MAEEKMANGKLSKRNKSNTNYFLTVTVIILVIAICAGAGLVYFHIIPNLEDRVCQSDKSWTNPTDLIALVDSTSDPCENFTRFICSSREETSLGKKLMQMRARTFLKQGMVEQWEPLGIVKKFYESCRDTDSMDEAGNDKILSIINKLNVWPLWNKESFDFNITNFLDRSLAMNLPFEWLFRISVNAVPISDRLETMAQLAPPEKLNYFKHKNRIAEYISLIHITLAKLYNNYSTIITKEQIEKIVKFEKNLKETWERFNSSKAVPITNKDLSKIFPSVDVWILTKWLPKNVSHSRIAVDVNVMKKLNLFLKETSNQTLAHFLVWKVVEHYGFFLHNDLRKMFEDFHNFISREELCLDEANERFPKVFDLFYKKFYLQPGKKIHNIDEMTSTIKTAILSKLKSTAWIDENTSDLIVKKLSGMSSNFKIMDNIDNVLIQAIEASVDEVFQLNDTSSDIFKILETQSTFLLITRRAFMDLASMDLLEVLQKPVPRLVEYNENNNELVFSYMTLDDYIFNIEEAPYRNYGLFGTRMAREMSKSIQINALYGKDSSRFRLWRNMSVAYRELYERNKCLRIRDEALPVGVSMSALIVYLRDFLLDYCYPTGNLLDESSFADVFLKPNRRFLLAWTMAVYRGEEIEQMSHEWDEGLPGRLVEMGFVDERDVDAFVGAEMVPEMELQIFRNMFEFIRAMKAPAPALEERRARPIEEYFQEREPVSLPAPEKPVKNIPKILIDIPEPDMTIRDCLLEVESEMKSLEETQTELMKLKLFDKEEIQISFPEDFPQIVSNCKKNLEDFQQYIEDVKSIGKFLEAPEESSIPDSDPVDAAASFLEGVAAKLAAIQKIRKKAPI